MTKVITLEPLDVMYVAEKGNPQFSAGKAFEKLEQVVSLKGRRFYGIWDSNRNEYRAATKIQEGDNPKKLGLETFTITGGKYATAHTEGPYLEIVRKIGPMFASLEKEFTTDKSRLPIEFYKRHTEVHIYLPII